MKNKLEGFVKENKKEFEEKTNFIKLKDKTCIMKFQL